MNLFEAARLIASEPVFTQSEVDARFKLALSPEYWCSLHPSLTIEKDSTVPANPGEIDESSWEEVGSHFRLDGYFKTDRVLSTAVLDLLQSAVTAVMAGGWPPVFALVYDQIWASFRSESFRSLLCLLLGQGYKQIPHVWIHCVIPGLSASGWAPHVDGPRPHRLTVWIALTDATLDNGCMYVIPSSAMPERVRENYLRLESVSSQELWQLLQSSRALPVSAGSVLGWNFEVIHWGTRCGQSKEPRISLSLEFIAQNAEPKRDETPLLDVSSLPEFSARLKLISRAILRSVKFEPSVIRFEQLAHRLVDV